MAFADRIRANKKREPSEDYNLVRGIWPLLPGETKAVASAFSNLAIQDAEVSSNLFKSEMYAQSVYHFQQAVEKASKAWGLLAGSIQPTSRDLTNQVSHRSMLGIMLHMPEQMARLPSIRQALRRNLDEAKLKQLGVWDFFGSLIQEQDSRDATLVRKAIEQIKAMNPAHWWKVSLELKPGDPFTKAVFNGLEEADRRNRDADKVEAAISQSIRPMLAHPEDLDFLLNMYYRAGPELFPLTLVSMWHEKETRYPPIEPRDYWDPDAYTSDRGLVKNFDMFHTHTTRLCGGVAAALRAAL